MPSGLKSTMRTIRKSMMGEVSSYSRSSFEWGLVDVVFGLARPVDRRSGSVGDEQLEGTGSIPQLIPHHLCCLLRTPIRF